MKKQFSRLCCSVIVLAISSLPLGCLAQFDETALEKPDSAPVNLGIGLGQGYGGIGFRLTGHPTETIGLFGGLGYNFLSAAWNLGVNVRLSNSRVKPNLKAMYGYNAVIIVAGADQYNKTYYGPSFGGGIELHKKDGQSFWNFELIFPVRSQEFKDDMKALQNNPAVTISDLLPFTIGVGYHFQFN